MEGYSAVTGGWGVGWVAELVGSFGRPSEKVNLLAQCVTPELVE